MALITDYDELELFLPLNHLEMLYHVHSPALREHPHVQKTYWEGILTRRKVETSDLPCSQRDYKCTAAETHMGREKAGHWCLKGVEEMNATFLKYLFF